MGVGCPMNVVGHFTIVLGARSFTLSERSFREPFGIRFKGASRA